MQNLMVDIETLDTRDTAVILSVGAVRFDASGLGETFYAEVNIDDQLRHKRTISGKTVQWWNEQSEEARRVITNNDKAGRLASALAKFTALFPNDKTASPILVWGNGAAFDNAILRNAYEGLGIEAPWAFYNDRCYRTLKNLFPDVKMAKAPVIAHNSLDDAVAQANHAIQLLQCSQNSVRS